MDGYVDFGQLLAGLGLFLFAMLQLEEAIKALAGRSFKSFLKNNTDNRFRGLVTGVVLTAILQSSSAVSLLLLAFVGAGIISMQRALPVVFGSNLGTTVTGWIVATIGFKLPIDTLALPLVGIGGLVLFFFYRFPRYFNTGRCILSFGLIFLGLDYMKVSIEELAPLLDLSQLLPYGTLAFFAAGVVLTALIQSSSAVMVIALSALYSGLLTLPPAVALVVGANVGTTLTVFLGSLGGIPAKKQVAFAHFLFNGITAGVALAVLPWLLTLLTRVLLIRDSLLALVTFHTLFNLLGVLLFLPFVQPLARGLERWFVAKRVVLSHYLHRVTTQVPDAAIESLRQEARRLLSLAMWLNLKAFRLTNEKLTQVLVGSEATATVKFYRQSYERGYRLIKQLEGEMLRYSADIQKKSLEPDESHQLSLLMRVIQHTMHAVKDIKDIEHNVVDFESHTKSYYRTLLDRFRESNQRFYEALLDVYLAESVSLEEFSDLMTNVQQQYERLLGTIYQTVDKKSLDEVMLSTFSNVNRELYSSQRAMLLAVGDLRGFPSEPAVPPELSQSPALS